MKSRVVECFMWRLLCRECSGEMRGFAVFSAFCEPQLFLYASAVISVQPVCACCSAYCFTTRLGYVRASNCSALCLARVLAPRKTRRRRARATAFGAAPRCFAPHNFLPSLSNNFDRTPTVHATVLLSATSSCVFICVFLVR